MPTKTTARKREIVYGTKQALKAWRRFQGLLIGKGPKDPVAWQRKTRRDRTIVPSP